MMNNKMPVGIYIHIPFCVKKCAYCDFLSMPADESVKEAYLSALEKDIMQTVTPAFLNDYIIDTVFIGGGTPSSLSYRQLVRLCRMVSELFACGASKVPVEVTMECNPGTLSLEKAAMLKEYGINRVSLGLQSVSDEELRLLGRIHTFEDFLNSYELLDRAGITNINVDLMSGLPGQTMSSWENTLASVAELSPAHISAYGLIIEEGTPFFERFAGDEKIRANGGIPQLLPDEDSERRMYCMTEEFLGGFGYSRYEISNYSRSGFECRHNTGYWTGKPYLGIGLGASSYMFRDSKRSVLPHRFTRTSALKEYINGDFSEYGTEIITKEMQMEEFMFLGLRMMEGVSKQEFKRRFDVSFDEVYDRQSEHLFEDGLLRKNGDDRICLTKRGIDVSNYVFGEFLLRKH